MDADAIRRQWLPHEDAIIAYLFERIEQWRRDGYQPPQTYFTAGLERQVANMITATRAALLDEVERFRAQCAGWAENSVSRSSYDALEAERDALRAENAALHESNDNAGRLLGEIVVRAIPLAPGESFAQPASEHAAVQAVERLRAEVERLRKETAIHSNSMARRIAVMAEDECGRLRVQVERKNAALEKALQFAENDKRKNAEGWRTLARDAIDAFRREIRAVQPRPQVEDVAEFERRASELEGK